MGGTSTMVLSGSNSFNQVLGTAYLNTGIADDSLIGSYSLTTTKTVDNIVASHVGPIRMSTISTHHRPIGH